MRSGARSPLQVDDPLLWIIWSLSEERDRAQQLQRLVVSFMRQDAALRLQAVVRLQQGWRRMSLARKAAAKTSGSDAPKWANVRRAQSAAAGLISLGSPPTATPPRFRPPTVAMAGGASADTQPTATAASGKELL